MPNTYDNDRITFVADGRIELESALDKGWNGRKARSGESDFPGTPVLWEDEWYEVVSARPRSSGTWLYHLEPWNEDHPLRNPSRYDEDSARALRHERERDASRRKKSGFVLLFGLVLGHAPAHAQLELERELGVLAKNLSLVSILPLLAFAGWVAARLPVRNALGIESPEASPELILLSAYLLVESLVRLALVLSRGYPWGSVAGVIGYEVWRMTTATGRAFEKRAAAPVGARLKSRSTREEGTDDKERDAYTLREPFVALLSPSEQLRIKSTFGFNPKTWGRRTAVVLSIFSTLGVSTGLTRVVKGDATLWTWSSILVAGLLLAEQIGRLKRIERGEPAGSVLGGLVRAWCRGILLAEPMSLKAGSTETAPPVLPDVWEGDEPDDATLREH